MHVGRACTDQGNHGAELFAAVLAAPSICMHGLACFEWGRVQPGGGWWGTSLHARHALVLFRSIMFCVLRGCWLSMACF
jgi:hypothetical protein